MTPWVRVVRREEAMRIGIGYGRDTLHVEVASDRLAGTRPEPSAPLADPAAAIRFALEAPYHFPSLRRALTPDDHVALIVDEHLPTLAQLLTPILAHIVEA